MMNNKKYQEDIEKTIDIIGDFSKIKNKSILILGATGTIGSFITNLLIVRNIKYHDNIKIYIGSRSQKSLSETFKEYMEYDFLIPIVEDITKEVTFNIKVDYIIHSASSSYPKAMTQTPVEIMLSNFIGINNLLNYCKNNLNTRLIYISSGEVYGKYEEQTPIKEDYQGFIDNLNPRSCYPVSKRAAETLCISYSKEYQVDVSIVRPSHIYSPYYLKEDNKVHIAFINDVLNNNNIKFKKGEKVYRTYTYIADVVSGIFFVLFKGISGEAYNISSDDSNVTIEQMAKYISELAKKDIEYIEQKEEEKSNNNPMTYAILDNSKLKLLGWHSIYNFHEGIKRTMEIRKDMI